jgi:uncharacterized membrane protein YgdD (TMEM256/DUF423 family)
MQRTFFVMGALFALMGVAAGAFGAHVLEGRLSAENLVTFETGVRYQMYHALGLLAVAWAAERWTANTITLAGWFFSAGIIVFSGSLYALAFGAPRVLGAITPFGGVAFLAGWAVLAAGAAAQDKSKPPAKDNRLSSVA